MTAHELIPLFLLWSIWCVTRLHGVVIPASCNRYCDQDFVDCVIVCDYREDMEPWQCRTECIQIRRECVLENCPILKSGESTNSRPYVEME
ncbi:hypothetical protein AHF37_08408 [Paragonimus kellicotti]|nr:hypothetical protein AHF37_08408 [Paragonimus kellicotti]